MPPQPVQPARIVIADESPFVQAGIRGALEDAGLAVIATCGDAASTRERVLAEEPDALLLSVHLPGGAIDLMRAVHGVLPSVELILMADDAPIDLMMSMVEAGAHGFLLGKTDPLRLPHAVTGVLAGEAAFPRVLVRAMADELAMRDRRHRLPGPGSELLTRREAEVLEHLAVGLPPGEAARRMGISDATVRRHVANALQKLGAPDRASAIRMLRAREQPQEQAS